MSTKISLNYCVDEASGMTANLSEECLAPEHFPLTLEFTGVTDAAMQMAASGNRIAIDIPRGLAVKLGLLRDSLPTAEVKIDQ